MKKAFVFLSLVSIGIGIKYDGLKVKFGWSGAGAGKEYFFPVPRTTQEAVAAGWHLTERPQGPLMDLKMYCAPKRIVCPLYVADGFVAGMQISIPAHSLNADLKPEKYLVKWSAPAADGEPAGEFWTATQFYVTEDSLKYGTGPTIANGSTLQSEGVWINDLNGNLIKVALTETDIAATPPFKKQNCIINMGTHYYYNMTKQLGCDKFILPWFAMVTKGDMLGVGFQTFGKAPIPDKDREWFENIPLERDIPLMTTPDAPECYLDLFMKYGGLVSIHIYYINEPWEIKCEPGDSVDQWLAIGGVNAHCRSVKNGQRHPKNSLQINLFSALFHYLLW